MDNFITICRWIIKAAIAFLICVATIGIIAERGWLGAIALVVIIAFFGANLCKSNERHNGF